MKKLNLTARFIVPFVLFFSCTSEYYSLNDFSSTPKIDTHAHLDAQGSTMAEQAIADNFRFVFINTDMPETVSIDEQFVLASAQNKQFPNNISFVTTFSLKNWNSPDWVDKTIAKLNDDFNKGAIGVKIWKNIGMTFKDSTGEFIMIDNPRFDPIIKFIESKDKVVVGHLGEPKDCWLPIDQMTVNGDKNYYRAHPEYHMYLHPESPSYDEQIAARDHFLELHPTLRFVGAHLGSLEWSVDELAKRLDKFPNMAVDFAERICHLQYQSQQEYNKVRNFILKYQDRLIYGTDFYIEATSNIEQSKSHWHDVWLSDWRYFVTDDILTSPNVDGNFTGLKLPKAVIDKIYYRNAYKWFKINE
ncbi:MAG: amidohydrolase family protein [Prolixibacteraceae bacterium]|nr:amidohydrolase family protein [Prolixibacteraceae bacterium]